MTTESENGYETVIIEGEVWAVTTPSPEESSSEEAVVGGSESMAEAADTGLAPSENLQPGEAVRSVEAVPESTAEPVETPAAATVNEAGNGTENNETGEEEEFDALQALTKLLVGGAIEGTNQLTMRLREYEEVLRQEAAERSAAGETAESIEEDELVRLRYALVGLIFDAQATFRRNVTLWAKIADKSVRATNWAAQPVTNSFLFNPMRRRYDRLIRRGEESLARWIDDGRAQEPPSRELARMTYVEIVDEFIDRLAENPQLQAVITKQSLGVASDMRDEVRERTVTADNLVENLVRRILRRTPRAELPEPPPQVQRWAGLTLEEYRTEMQKDDSAD